MAYGYGVVKESAARTTAYLVVIGMKQPADGLLEGKGVYPHGAVVIPDKFMGDVSKAVEITHNKVEMGRV